MAAVILAIVAVVAAGGYAWWYEDQTGRMGDELTSTFPALASASWECGGVQALGRPQVESVTLECDQGSAFVVVTRFRTPGLATDYKTKRAAELLAEAKVLPWRVNGALSGEKFVNGGGADSAGAPRSLWAGYFYDDARYVVEVVADDQRSVARIVRGLELPTVAELPD